jgi:TolB-like protein
MDRSRPRPALLRFGPFEADPHTRELRKHGLRLQLRDQSFELLLALLERPGELVSREDLRRRLWPEGIFVDFENSLNSAVNRLREALSDSPARPKYVETLPRLGYRFIASVGHAGSPVIAVLPFENLNRDPEQDYFAEGVADALTTALGNVSTLRVISRQSVLHFRGSRKTVPEIARELHADALVEGSVLYAGGRVRITAQLIQASPEQHLWARAYDCEIGDILTVQGEVAGAIAHAVQVVLSPAETSRLARPRRVDPRAQVEYLKGCHFMDRWTREGFLKGLEHLHAALEQDPGHAEACARAADTYALLGFWGHIPPPVAFPRAKQLALEALALDNTLSTAHWALAWAGWLHDWDLAQCEAEARTALELNPSDELAHVMYAMFYAVVREDHASAAAEARLALDLGPLSVHVNTSVAWIYLWGRDYDLAQAQARKTLELFPEALQAYYVLGLAEVGRGRFADSIAHFERACAISDAPISLGYLGNAYGRARRIEAATAVLNELLARREREHVSLRSLELVYVGLGDFDAAFEVFEQAYANRDPTLFFTRAIPAFDPLRSDPRFDSLVRRLLPSPMASALQ